MTSCEEQIAILEKALGAFSEEYKEQSDIWRTHDQKAQGIIAASGIFVAAAFAFSREPTLLPYTKFFVGCTLTCLFLSIMAAFGVLQPYNYEIPDGDKALQNARARLKASPNPSVPGDRLEQYLHDLLSDTTEVLPSLELANQQKQQKLQRGQFYVAVAVYFSIAASFLHMIFGAGR